MLLYARQLLSDLIYLIPCHLLATSTEQRATRRRCKLVDFSSLPRSDYRDFFVSLPYPRIRRELLLKVMPVQHHTRLHFTARE